MTLEILTFDKTDLSEGVLVGEPVELWCENRWFDIQEFINPGVKHPNQRHTWKCVERGTGKVVWDGPCRSTKECMRFVMEALQAKRI